MGALIYIINQGRIYWGYHKDLYDENVIPRLSRILRDIPKSSTFDVLKRGLKLRWKEAYDVIIPYGDLRYARFETVWKFDLDNDQLVFDKSEGQSGRLALSVLRQSSFTFDDFESCESLRTPKSDPLTTFQAPYWQLVPHVPQRKIAFTHRVLEDFNFQWRHILRHRYNNLTFRKIAQAIFSVATFNFRIKELNEPRHKIGGALIGPLDLPEWDPLERKIVLVGGVWFAAFQDPTEALSSIREHQAAQQTTSPNTYLIMSVRHIILCRFIEDNLKWTQPIPFLNGDDPVSEIAVELLLEATSNHLPLKTPLHRLPVELQIRILRYVSQGPVEAARIGCILGLGLPFAWKDGKMDIERLIAHGNRHPDTPVESQLWFGDHFGGVAYKGI